MKHFFKEQSICLYHIYFLRFLFNRETYLNDRPFKDQNESIFGNKKSIEIYILKIFCKNKILLGFIILPV